MRVPCGVLVLYCSPSSVTVWTVGVARAVALGPCRVRCWRGFAAGLHAAACVLRTDCTLWALRVCLCGCVAPESETPLPFGVFA